MSRWAKQSNMIVPAGTLADRNRRAAARRKLALIGLISLGAIVFVAVVTSIVVHIRRAPEPVVQHSFINQNSKAVALTAHGNYPEAKKLLLSSLDTATTKAEKAEVYRALATIALQAQKYDEALSFANQAESLEHSVDSAAELGGVYMQSKDWANAAKWFHTAADRAPKSERKGGNNSYGNNMTMAQYAESQIK